MQEARAVSGFDLESQSYEIWSKFINIPLIYSANLYRARHCIRYWVFGLKKIQLKLQEAFDSKGRQPRKAMVI